MRVSVTALPGVLRLGAEPARDERGGFTRIFCATTFAGLGLDFAPRQTSVSRTARRGTLRGLHFQLPPAAETKLVCCIAGAVFDVVVDLRRESPSYRQAVTTELRADDGTALLVPPGCAHGVLTLTDDAALLYQIDRDYDPTRASGVRWNDPAFAIAWPFPPVVIAARDAAWPDHGA
jgi:dTDP-4-dehydrorhamnose 3,5-epimerase